MNDEQAKQIRSEAARAMGSARSERKTAAVQQNGKLGGRPKGSMHTEESKQKMRDAYAKRKLDKQEDAVNE